MTARLSRTSPPPRSGGYARTQRSFLTKQASAICSWGLLTNGARDRLAIRTASMVLECLRRCAIRSAKSRYRRIESRFHFLRSPLQREVLGRAEVYYPVPTSPRVHREPVQEVPHGLPVRPQQHEYVLHVGDYIPSAASASRVQIRFENLV